MISGINDIIFVLVELIKAKISTYITKYANEIESEPKLPRIGFINEESKEGDLEIDDD